MMSFDEKNEEIKQLLIKHLSPYLLILFGSRAENRDRADSDYDIAFLSDQKFSPYDLYMIAQRLASILNQDVDLLDLSQVSTVMKVQILHKGKVIYCSDDQRRMDFAMKAYKMYVKLNEERQIVIDEIRKRGSIYGE